MAGTQMNTQHNKENEMTATFKETPLYLYRVSVEHLAGACRGVNTRKFILSTNGGMTPPEVVALTERITRNRKQVHGGQLVGHGLPGAYVVHEPTLLKAFHSTGVLVGDIWGQWDNVRFERRGEVMTATSEDQAILYLHDGITVRYYVMNGGYPIYYIASDNGIVCAGCVQDNLELCRDKEEPQWFVERHEINWESDILCGHCEQRVESAHGAFMGEQS